MEVESIRIIDVDTKEPQDAPAPVADNKPKKEKVPKIVYGIVTAPRLNVRRGPSIDSAVATVVKLGEELKIDRDKSNKEWYSVMTENRVYGYVMKEFVKIKR